MAQSLAAEASVARDFSDEALATEAKSGGDGFGILYQRYMPRVYGYLRTRTATAEETADLTQTVFLEAMSSLCHFDPRRGLFSPWLFRIARNKAVDAHRKRKTTISWDALPDGMAGFSKETPEDSAVRSEQVELARMLLRDIPARKRELLALRFGAGLSSREIGYVTGKSGGAVKKELTRILAQLKEKSSEQQR